MSTYCYAAIAERIKQTAKNNKVSIKQMLNDLGMGINLISHLAKGQNISSISLAQIADYLNCSVDYLLGRTDNPRELTENQQELLSLFNQIEDERNQIKALGQIELIIKEFVNEQ